MQKAILPGFIIVGTAGLIYGFVIYMGTVGFLSAWILNFMLMMCVFMFTETLKSKFSSDYYKEKVWERKGKIYEKLGINIFRKLLVFVGWEKLNKKANPVKNNIEALAHLEYRTKQSELGHLIIFFIVFGFTVYVAIEFSIAESMWLFFLNIILNVYPIFLQRYNRPRLQRALELIQYQQRRMHTSG